MLLGTSKSGRTAAAAIQDHLQEGDIIFIAVPIPPFTLVAKATGGWVNHVGIAFKDSKGGWDVHESTVPWARRCSLAKFLSRSKKGRVAVKRLRRPLGPDELVKLQHASRARMGRPYHFGFNLESSRQFCSKFVHEVYREALAIQIGRNQSFSELIQENPGHSLGFWRLWFFGRIPVERRTVTPESLYRDSHLVTVCEPPVR